MAVSFKTDANYGYTLMPFFGVNAEIIKAAKQSGVKIEQGSPGTFLIKSGGVTHASIKVQGQAISLAKSGALGPSNKTALRIQFEAGLNKATQHAMSKDMTAQQAVYVGMDYAAGEDSTVILPVKPGSIAKGYDDIGNAEPTGPNPMHEKVGKPMPWKKAVKLDAYGNIVPSPVKPAASQGQTFPVKPAPTGGQSSIVPSLINATKVYEATKGTTPGSLYYVFAMFHGLNLSARYKHGKLSIRAEGSAITGNTGIPAHTMALKDFGMDHNGSYMSGHYECTSISMVQKALGAVISRVGFQHLRSVADISTLLESAA